MVEFGLILMNWKMKREFKRVLLWVLFGVIGLISNGWIDDLLLISKADEFQYLFELTFWSQYKCSWRVWNEDIDLGQGLNGWTRTGNIIVYSKSTIVFWWVLMSILDGILGWLMNRWLTMVLICEDCWFWVESLISSRLCSSRCLLSLIWVKIGN